MRIRDRENRIKLEDCEHRKLYLLDARNLKIGVFDQETQGFVGIRTKFTARFLDTEFHWDAPEFATCCPMVVIGELPADIEIQMYFGTECKGCQVPVTYKKYDVPREVTLTDGYKFMAHGQWEHLAPTACDKADPVTVNNKKLFNWLEEQEKNVTD